MPKIEHFSKVVVQVEETRGQLIEIERDFEGKTIIRIQDPTESQVLRVPIESVKQVVSEGPTVLPAHSSSENKPNSQQPSTGAAPIQHTNENQFKTQHPTSALTSVPQKEHAKPQQSAAVTPLLTSDVHDLYHSNDGHLQYSDRHSQTRPPSIASQDPMVQRAIEESLKDKKKPAVARHSISMDSEIAHELAKEAKEEIITEEIEDADEIDDDVPIDIERQPHESFANIPTINNHLLGNMDFYFFWFTLMSIVSILLWTVICFWVYPDSNKSLFHNQNFWVLISVGLVTISTTISFSLDVLPRDVYRLHIPIQHERLIALGLLLLLANIVCIVQVVMLITYLYQPTKYEIFIMVTLVFEAIRLAVAFHAGLYCCRVDRQIAARNRYVKRHFPNWMQPD